MGQLYDKQKDKVQTAKAQAQTSVMKEKILLL